MAMDLVGIGRSLFYFTTRGAASSPVCRKISPAAARPNLSNTQRHINETTYKYKYVSTYKSFPCTCAGIRKQITAHVQIKQLMMEECVCVEFLLRQIR